MSIVGGDNGWKKTALITVFVVLLWVLPIYAMDSGNTTSNQSVNSTEHLNHASNGSSGDDMQSQIMTLKSTPSGRYKDVQDLHLKILQILEGIHLLRQENATARSIKYYGELETRSAELESLMRSIIRG
ncbi:MAG: hypothetical protein B655_1910 [Methanobacterium sp. Maddingley MBC34]|nr:MAG: hypothetical protein B655_1910 [Methanobacterium sp. Maddingley MBC34]